MQCSLVTEGTSYSVSLLCSFPWSGVLAVALHSNLRRFAEWAYGCYLNHVLLVQASGLVKPDLRVWLGEPLLEGTAGVPRCRWLVCGTSTAASSTYTPCTG